MKKPSTTLEEQAVQEIQKRLSKLQTKSKSVIGDGLITVQVEKTQERFKIIRGRQSYWPR